MKKKPARASYHSQNEYRQLIICEDYLFTRRRLVGKCDGRGLLLLTRGASLCELMFGIEGGQSSSVCQHGHIQARYSCHVAGDEASVGGKCLFVATSLLCLAVSRARQQTPKGGPDRKLSSGDTRDCQGATSGTRGALSPASDAKCTLRSFFPKVGSSSFLFLHSCLSVSTLVPC